MRKSDLVASVSKSAGIDKTVVETVIDEVFMNIKQAVIDGDTVTIRGFATIGRKRRAGKVGRNIITGTRVDIPAHDIPYAKFGKYFEQDVWEPLK